MRSALVLALLLLAGAAPARAQTQPVGAVFQIRHNGMPIGVATASVAPEGDGWIVQGTSYVGGDYKLTVRRFDAHYDAEWRALAATMELSTPMQSVLVHSGINGGDARTDISHDGTIDIGRQRVSADTIIVPDMVFTAYEALAQRLARARTGARLPVFLLPFSEIQARIDASDLEVVMTRSGGRLPARRWRIAFLTQTRETVAEIWEAQGRLLRVEMPADGISVIRSDITP